MMKKIIFYLTTVLMGFFICITSANAGMIYFKNGNVLEGEIVKLTEDEITIRYNFGLVSFKKSRIEAIEASTETESLLLGGRKKLTEDDLVLPPIELPYFDTHPREYKNMKVLDSSKKALSAVNILKERLDKIMEDEKAKLSADYKNKKEFYIKRLIALEDEIEVLNKEIMLLKDNIRAKDININDLQTKNNTLKEAISKRDNEIEVLKEEKVNLLNKQKQLIEDHIIAIKDTENRLAAEYKKQETKLTKKFEYDKSVLNKIISEMEQTVDKAKNDIFNYETKERNLQAKVSQKDTALKAANFTIEKQQKEIDKLNREISAYRNKMSTLQAKHEEEKIDLFSSIVTEAMLEVNHENEFDVNKKTKIKPDEIERTDLSHKDKDRLIEYLRIEISKLEKNKSDQNINIAELSEIKEQQHGQIVEMKAHLNTVTKKLDIQEEKNYNLTNRYNDLKKEFKETVTSLKMKYLDQIRTEKEKLINAFNEERRALKELIKSTSVLVAAEKEIKLEEMATKELSAPHRDSAVIGKVSDVEANVGRIFINVDSEVQEGDEFFVIRDNVRLSKIIVLKYIDATKGAVARVIPQDTAINIQKNDIIAAAN